MVSTVRFSSALEACLDNNPKITVLVEVGPHPALKGPVLEIIRKLGRDSIAYSSSCSRGIEDLKALLVNAGAIIGHGVLLRAANINAREIVKGLECNYEYSNILTDLPSYQWNHSIPFWEESRVSRNVRYRKFRRHQLLGSRYVDDIPSRPSWRNFLMLRELPWLMDMKVRLTVSHSSASRCLRDPFDHFVLQNISSYLRSCHDIYIIKYSCTSLLSYRSC